MLAKEEGRKEEEWFEKGRMEKGRKGAKGKREKNIEDRKQQKKKNETEAVGEETN